MTKDLIRALNSFETEMNHDFKILKPAREGYISGSADCFLISIVSASNYKHQIKHNDPFLTFKDHSQILTADAVFSKAQKLMMKRLILANYIILQGKDKSVVILKNYANNMEIFPESLSIDNDIKQFNDGEKEFLLDEIETLWEQRKNGPSLCLDTKYDIDDNPIPAWLPSNLEYFKRDEGIDLENMLTEFAKILSIREIFPTKPPKGCMIHIKQGDVWRDGKGCVFLTPSQISISGEHQDDKREDAIKCANEFTKRYCQSILAQNPHIGFGQRPHRET